MFKYHLLRRDSDPKVLGVNNGIKQAEIKRSGFLNPDKFDVLKDALGTNNYWLIKDSIHELEFELECVELLPKAKLTSFLQFGPALINCPFLIAENIANIFSRHRMCEYGLFPATVVTNADKHTYFLPHYPRQPDSIIDFTRSTFATGIPGINRNYHTFASEDEKNVFQKHNVLLDAEEIYLKDDFDQEMDFFVMKDSQIVVSDRLKDDLEKSGFTSGIKLLPAYGENVSWTKIRTR